uniref:Uncharacterized protein n=1 Tax=Rhizophora mucronata TaxID=61149 RepID=A0A2P2M901_RHIMU
MLYSEDFSQQGISFRFSHLSHPVPYRTVPSIPPVS